MEDFAKYCRVLRRIKNRNAALQESLRPRPPLSSRVEPSKKPTVHSRLQPGYTCDMDDRPSESARQPLNYDDLTYLDERDARAMMRETYAEAVEHAPRKKDIIIVNDSVRSEH